MGALLHLPPGFPDSLQLTVPILRVSGFFTTGFWTACHLHSLSTAFLNAPIGVTSTLLGLQQASTDLLGHLVQGQSSAMGSVEESTLLDSLPARPPTPPREANHGIDNLVAAKPVVGRASDFRPSVNTPPNLCTPDASTTTSSNPSRIRKTVGFSAQAQYKEAPRYTEGERAKRSSPPSASQPKPPKGILKASVDPRPFDKALGSSSEDSMEPIGILDLLESTLKQLAGSDRDAKFDAYTMLVRSLQVSNNLPDRIALREKMGLFVQFIQRDITSKNPNSSPDSALIAKAITLLDTFLFFPAIASTIPNDFGVFIIDHCIRSFEDHSLPKDVARRLIHVVATQDFPPRVMTSDRVRRLVAALHNLDGPVRGKSTIVYRTRIYARLILQAQAHMAVHADWLNDVFTDMLSGVKDIRNAAIKLGSEAAFVFGKDKQLSRKVLELLDTSIEEMTYIEWYREQLSRMAKSQDKAFVPRIWSVIVLLLRSPLERWRFFNPWLHLVQECFNSPDTGCNREANYAWNRFVYTMHLDEKSFLKTFSTLYKPIGSQLSKTNISEQKREILLGGLCNLYYYAFKPNTNPSHLDTFWDMSVKPLTDGLVPVKRGQEFVDDHLRRSACILIGLLDSSTPRMWKEDRIKDSPTAKPDELPMIDPKWVRHNASRVFSVIAPIMDQQFCELSDESSLVRRLWRTLVSSVAFAASKEIKVSNDTAIFVSETFSLLLKHWQTGVPEDQPELADRFLHSAQELVLALVEALGLLPFTGKVLSLGRLCNFAPVATPSHKPVKNLGDVRTPLQHLFGLFSRPPPGVADNDAYLVFLQSVFAPFFSTQKSARARSDVAMELLQAVPIWSPQTSQYPYAPWVLASESLIAAMDVSQNGAQPSEDANLGHEYRSIVRMLERGWKETPNLPFKHWHALYSTLANRAAAEVGDAGRAIGVIEPLAKVVRESLPADDGDLPATTVQFVGDLISAAKQPQDRQALEAARRRLWGTAISGSRSASIDPFDHLYKLTNDLLLRLYSSNGRADSNDVSTAFLKEVAGFLSRCHSQLVHQSIVNLQHGISTWIQDKQGLIHSRRDTALSAAVSSLAMPMISSLTKSQMTALWKTTGDLIFSEAVPQLETFEPLLCAAFESKHRQIVNMTAEIWNRVFEHADNVQYPESLKTTLQSAQSYIDLHLPGLPISRTPMNSKSLSFVDSEDDLGAGELPVLSARRGLPPLSTASRHSACPSPVKLPLSERRQRDGTPRKTRSSNRSTPTSRLRHDDSQLHFVAVESSPSVPNQESQVLTERQKEVRDRQKDNAAMLPDFQSSPRTRSGGSAQKRVSKPKSKSPAAVKQGERQNEATPEPRAEFNDYVTSTPTPRRGQAMAMDIDDPDMTDPPSSPLEPRPFPLLPQIQSRSSSRGEIDHDWPLSSSPVGSPTLAPQAEVDPEVSEMNVDDGHEGDAKQNTEEQQPAVDGSLQMEVVPSSAPAEAALAVSEGGPLEAADAPLAVSRTKPRNTSEEPRTPRHHRQFENEPRSDDQEEFVDALTSPQADAHAAARARTKTLNGQTDGPGEESSFVMSDGDERSMLRLVVELDSRRCEIPMTNHPASSPCKGVNDHEVQECITVVTPDDEEERDPSNDEKENVRPRKSTPRPSSVAETAAPPSSSEEGSKRKRKRSDNARERRRKRRKGSVDGNASQGGSQVSSPAAAGGSPSSVRSMIPANKAASTAKDVEVPSSPPVEDVSPTKARKLSSPQRRRTRSYNEASEEKDTDTEVESQLVAEQQAASQSQSRQADEAEADAAAPSANEAPDHHDEMLQVGDPTSMELDSAEPTPTETEEHDVLDTTAPKAVAGAAAPQPDADVPMLESLTGVLGQLRSAALSRDDVYKMEDMLMDIKRELYAAEQRGRN